MLRELQLQCYFIAYETFFFFLQTVVALECLPQEGI
jgi:hypothetical protein